MFNVARIGLTLILLAGSISAFAQDTILFNGTDLEGWTFSLREGEDPTQVEEAWIVRNGMLISTGSCFSFLKHKDEFEDYELTFEWRSMTTESGGGMAVSGGGSLFIHTTDEEGSFYQPKSVRVGLFNDSGNVYLTYIEPNSDTKWAFPAPDFADDIEREMGEWNRMKVIARGNQVTVILNGTPVNQVEGLERTKGSITLNSHSGFTQAPSFYRNIKIQPLSEQSEQDEAAAVTRLAEFKAVIAAKEAAEKAKVDEAKRMADLHETELEKQWGEIKVEQDIEFSAEATRLPFPKNMSDVTFDATFTGVELKSTTPLPELIKFYRTEMLRRGWKEVEKERDDYNVEIGFEHGKHTVELDLRPDDDDGIVDIELDCSHGMPFSGVNDPAGMVELGFPQAKGYLFLQKEIMLPGNVKDVGFSSRNCCSFISDLTMKEVYDQIGQELKAKGYIETRREPILDRDRHYTEYSKGNVELGINIFTDEDGARGSLTYDENN